MKVLSTATTSPRACAPLGERGDVGDVEQRVGGRPMTGARALRRRQGRVGVGDVDRRTSSDRRRLRQERACAVVAVTRHHDRAADRDLVEHGRGGRHPRREHDGGPAFEVAEDVLERGPGGVAVAAVADRPAGVVGGREHRGGSAVRRGCVRVGRSMAHVALRRSGAGGGTLGGETGISARRRRSVSYASWDRLGVSGRVW